MIPLHPSRFLAFDLGASSGRGVLGEIADDRLRTREICRFPNGMIQVCGHLHWNIFNLFEQVKNGLKLCAEEPETIPLSVGIDTWGVDFGFLANDGSILGLPYGYRDSRTDGAMESFFQKIPRERVYGLTGIQFLQLNSLFQLEAMVRDKSPLLSVARDLLFIPDLLTYLLTGVKKTEFSFATTSQLYNPIKEDWEEELLSALGLPGSLMQKIEQPGAVFGEIMPDVSKQTGLSPIPVIAVATHDTASAVAAVPAAGKDWAYISSGTWSLMGIEIDKPIITDQSLRLNFTNEGGMENTIRFLKNIAGLWLLEECRRVWAEKRRCEYDDLLVAATGAVPFAAFIDPDWSEFLNPPDMPAAIGRSLKSTKQSVPDSPGALVRCILESMALKYRLVLDQLRRLSPKPINSIHVIGGGAHNRLLCQFTANATGLPVMAGPVEAAAVGNIMAQALAAGCVTSLAGMREVISHSFILEKYEPEHVKEWETAYDTFREIISAPSRNASEGRIP
ncbi:MAG: rhamnulokinase [Candidatus Abyssobacteria bacterium SURF_5]|uniref:Rhamnulokinase n=1 Tax=Abyssobacteria bacterium (strain SURF_5) TaxID=2093360 RepID=A0A3A4P8R8_ABYX5|nr:MAG: rhamnulokinase [Candidatus Abyssubacteria bacterium SURF_5]